jgi:glycosyltransferase involved in cell wall biosynthesis
LTVPRLAIVCSHPIQYYVPVYQALAKRSDLQVRVFFGWRGNTTETNDPGFGQNLQWDIPLLEEYDYEFVDNIAADPGSHHYAGIDLPDLPQRLSEWNATAVLVYGWCYKAHLALMRNLHGRLPIFFRGDSTLLDDRPGIRCLLRRGALRWVYRHIDFAFYVGSNNYQYYRKHGLRDQQLIFAPHAVDNHRFASFEKQQAERVRSELGIGSDEIMLLFAGKLEAKKAPDQLLQAFVDAAQPGCNLVFGGSGELEQELRNKAVDKVHFLGFQNQSRMPAIYGAADLVALPSRGPGETWGLAINEAMAASCAVLASDCTGAAADLIELGVNGWISKANDQDDLSRWIQDALQLGREKLVEMGRESQRKIQGWSIDAQAESVGKAICRLTI